MSGQQRIARNTLLAIVGVAAAGVVRFVFTVALGREFGAALLGDIAVILAVATIATIPAAGVAAAGNRYLAVAAGAQDGAMRQNVLGATWRGGVIMTAAGVIVSWAYLNAQGATTFDATTLLLGLIFVASYGLYLTSKGVLFGDGRAVGYAIGELIGVASFAATLAFVLATSAAVGWTITSQVAWALGVVAVATAVGVGPTRLKGRAIHGLWAFASTATVGSLVSLGILQATVLVMAALHGSVQAGLLAAGLAITAPLYLLPRALSLALTPAMSSHVGAGERERANLDAAYTTKVLLLFGGVAAASIILASDFVLALYGDGFAEAKTYLTILAIASFIAISGIPVINRFASEGPGPLRITVIASAVGAVGAGALWLTLGSTSPAWIVAGFLLASVVKVAIPFAVSQRVAGTAITPPLALTLLVGSAVGAALVGGPWAFAYVAVVALVSAPTALVATIRYRAAAARLATERERLVVGVITNMYPHDGSPYYGVFVRNRVEAYRELGAEVVVVSPRRGSGLRKYLLLALDAVVALVRQPIPDVFEVHPTQPTGVIGMVASRLAGRPYVLYSHGSDVGIVARFGLHRSLVDRAVHTAAGIHTNSAYMAERITERWAPGSPPHILPPGVAVPRSVAPRRDRDIDVLFVGTLNHNKGVDVLLDAIAALEDGAELGVTIVGDGPEREQLEEIASRHRLDVRFVGVVQPDEVHALMARSRVLAVPSRQEALGQVAVEALAQGTPMIVSDVGGLGSVPTTACGSTAPPDDPEAVAAELRHWLGLTDHDWGRASRAAHERAEEFDLRVVAHQALTRLQAVAQPPGPHA